MTVGNSMKQKTLAIVKPDGVKKNVIGQIIARYEKAGLTVVALKMIRLNQESAEHFYAVHAQRPFFGELTDFISSGPIVVMILEGDDAINKNRELMGATNPQEAKEGTIRRDFADSIAHNIVHGSDGPDTAAEETAFFFGEDETFSR